MVGGNGFVGVRRREREVMGRDLAEAQGARAEDRLGFLRESPKRGVGYVERTFGLTIRASSGRQKTMARNFASSADTRLLRAAAAGQIPWTDVHVGAKRSSIPSARSRLVWVRPTS